MNGAEKRDALIDAVRSCPGRNEADLADWLIADGYRKVEVTDDMVERAARAHYRLSGVYRDRSSWDSMPLPWRLNRLFEMRRTLSAALGGDD